MDSKAKIAELNRKKEDLEAKLKQKYLHFRGVRHENSVSEMRYTEIKVIEAHIQSINEEIGQLESKLTSD